MDSIKRQNVIEVFCCCVEQETLCVCKGGGGGTRSEPHVGG